MKNRHWGTLYTPSSLTHRLLGVFWRQYQRTESRPVCRVSTLQVCLCQFAVLRCYAWSLRMIYGEHAYMGVRLHQGDRDWESGHGQRGGRGCLLHICCFLRTAAVAAVLQSKSAFLVRRACPCLPSDKKWSSSYCLRVESRGCNGMRGGKDRKIMSVINQ